MRSFCYGNQLKVELIVIHRETSGMWRNSTFAGHSKRWSVSKSSIWDSRQAKDHAWATTELRRRDRRAPFSGPTPPSILSWLAGAWNTHYFPSTLNRELPCRLITSPTPPPRYIGLGKPTPYPTTRWNGTNLYSFKRKEHSTSIWANQHPTPPASGTVPTCTPSKGMSILRPLAVIGLVGWVQAPFLDW